MIDIPDNDLSSDEETSPEIIKRKSAFNKFKMLELKKNLYTKSLNTEEFLKDTRQEPNRDTYDSNYDLNKNKDIVYNSTNYTDEQLSTIKYSTVIKKGKI